MNEHAIQKAILLDIGSRPDVRIWRNNVSGAWAGELLAKHPNGSVLLGHARPLHAGLFKGSADLIGLRKRALINLDGSFCDIGQFISLEVKTPAGRETDEQANWLRVIREFGGLAGIVRSVDEARALLL